MQSIPQEEQRDQVGMLLCLKWQILMLTVCGCPGAKTSEGDPHSVVTTASGDMYDHCLPFSRLAVGMGHLSVVARCVDIVH